MTNIFRQLILPWLLALLLAWLLVIVWLYNETRNQQLQQIQQLAVTVNYAVQANFPANDSPQLANQLRQIHYSSTLAVRHIAAYNAQLQLIASSASHASAPVLQSAPKTYQVSALPDGNQIALLPVSAGLAIEQSTAVAQLPDNGYVAVVFSTEHAWLVGLIPLVLLSIAMAVGLLISIGAVRRGKLRLATDVELLAHNFRRLQNARQHCQITEPIVPLLKPALQAFNELSSTLDKNQLATEQLVQQLNQRVQQLNAELAELEQQRQQLTTAQQLQHRQIRHWFAQSMFLWQRREQLQPRQLERLLQMHLLAGHYQFSDTNPKGQPVTLSSWLGQHIDELNELLPSTSVVLDWQEHPDNLAYSVNMCDKTLKSLLQALMMLCLRVEDVSKITITIQLQVGEQPPVLRLTASSNGNGLPAHYRELIQAGDLLDLQWSDVDVALLRAIQLTGTRFSSQSLDGLGCILQLTMPVQIEPVNAAKMLQQLLIFDTDEDRLQQRCLALSGVASQITKCNKLNELADVVQSQVFELVLLFLPAAPDSQDWQSVKRLARQQTTVLCFTAPELVPKWQQTIPEVQAYHQFCLAAVQVVTKQLPKSANLQQILVVDDNETNLAFVQVLLKNKPLVLHTATSAAQVFSLCQQHRFDMILLDIQLPDMSGVDIAKQLRQMPQYRQVPIVAFTAHAMPAEIESYRQAGMDDIVFKPLEPARLDSLLAKFSFTSN